jgi:hypothetical protein
MRDILAGQYVTVMTFDNRAVRRRAITGVVQGDDFSVVWVCDDAEYRSAVAEGREPVGIPWPSEHVRAMNTTG